MNKHFQPLRLAYFLSAAFLIMIFLHFGKSGVSLILSGLVVYITFWIFIGTPKSEYDKESLGNPFKLSIKDAGKIFSVEEVLEDKIGLMQYELSEYNTGGYNKESILRELVKNGTITFYRLDGFPSEAINIGSVLDIENGESGLTVKKRPNQRATYEIAV